MTARPLYPGDLIWLAYELAGRGAGPGRPSAIALRRAVSSAYYAMFHQFTWCISAELLGRQDDHRVGDVCRWIGHGDLFKLSASVLKADDDPLSKDNRQSGRPGANSAIVQLLDGPLDPRLVTFCDRFVDLQDQRNLADYDDSYQVSKESVLNLVVGAEEAIADLNGLFREGDRSLRLVLRLAVGGVSLAKLRPQQAGDKNQRR